MSHHRRLASDLFDADLAVHKIIWLAGIAARPSDDFKELVDDDPDELIKLLEIADPRELVECEACDGTGESDKGTECSSCAGKKMVREENIDAEELLTAAHRAGKFGFLVQVALPVRQYDKPDDDIYRSGWGHYRTHWVYVDKVEDVVQAAQPWVDRCIATDRKEAGRE
jgi:hypothetical protein